jgi:hypothetical protein
VNVTAAQPENDLATAQPWSVRPRVRRRTARVDVAVGALLALLALLLSPGLAVVAVVAVAMLALCGVSALLTRRRARRGAGPRSAVAVRLHPSERAPAS